MIKMISIQEAYQKKFARQAKVKGLKYACYGSCAYIGKDVSPGCYGCFYSDAYSIGLMLGKDVGLPNVCNRDCVYCFEPHRVQQTPVVPDDWKMAGDEKDILGEFIGFEKRRITTDCKMQYYEITGVCEPLLYMPVLRECMKMFREVLDPFMGTRGWAKLYTNGTLLTPDNILKLKEMGFDELRIHPAASNFSKEVYDNMRLAVKHIPTVTVETPAWPLHREKLFEMLPIIEDIGIKHLDICQVEITSKHQQDKVEKALGEIEVYQAYYPVMDDGGLVEDIVTEVLAKGYSYSVIDCNGFVKQSRSALTKHSYWSVMNQKFPPEWEKQRYGRKLKLD
jgi:pyruvate formate-lyase activating enzyme-like uncharacterized protein